MADDCGKCAPVSQTGKGLGRDPHHLAHVGRRRGAGLCDNLANPRFDFFRRKLLGDISLQHFGFSQFIVGQLLTTRSDILLGRFLALFDEFLDEFDDIGIFQFLLASFRRLGDEDGLFDGTDGVGLHGIVGLHCRHDVLLNLLFECHDTICLYICN